MPDVFSTADLRKRQSWEPTDILPVPVFVIGQPGEESVRLIELVEVLGRPLTSSSGPVVTSESIDPYTGQVTHVRNLRTQRGFRVGADDEGLDEDSLLAGDVLVPPDPDRPAFLVPKNGAGSITFWGGFTALRPRLIESVTLWALLSSRSGTQARRRAGSWKSGAARQLPALPVQLLAVDRSAVSAGRHSEHLAALLPTPPISLDAESPSISTFQELSLSEFPSWEHAIRSLTTSEPEKALPLEALGELSTGTQRAAKKTADGNSRLSILYRISDLQGDTPPKHRTEPSDATPDVQPGDVLIARTGPRRYVRVAPVEGFADRHIFVFKPRSPHIGEAVARYLRSPAGQERLEARSFGSTIGQLHKQDLAEMGVPVEILSDPDGGTPEPQLPLADRLEERLWT